MRQIKKNEKIMKCRFSLNESGYFIIGRICIIVNSHNIVTRLIKPIQIIQI